MHRPPGRARQFGAYNATETSPHRTAPPTRILAPDKLLTPRKRQISTATTIEQQTNSTLFAWMIRKHLDYVSQFEIHFRSGNTDLDNDLTGLLLSHARRENFDVGRRHNRDQWMKLFEVNKVVSGDAAAIKLQTGQLQGLQSDQIARPTDWGSRPPSRKKQESVSPHGLILDDMTGAVTEYCVCSRNAQGTMVFDHFEPAANILFDGYFTNFEQTRAPSPLIAALNDSIDLSDIRVLSKVNLKLKNLFGIAVFREQGTQLGTTTEEEVEAGESMELSPEQINILDLDVNDKVQAVETNSPGPNSIEFMDRLAQAVLLALDIPYTSLNSSRASFSARIADRAEYEESARGKRTKNADILREIYSWRIQAWYATNPQFQRFVDAAGMTPSAVARKLDIIPCGTPWMDKLNEVKGDALALALGQDSTPRQCRRRGLDAYQIGREQADYLAWAKEQGLPIFYAAGGQQAVQAIMTEPPAAPANNTGASNA